MNAFIPIILTLDSITLILLGILLIKESNCTLFNRIKESVLKKIPSNMDIHSTNPYEEM